MPEYGGSASDGVYLEQVVVKVVGKSLKQLPPASIRRLARYGSVMYVRRIPGQPRAHKEDITFRLLTPQIIEAEYRTLAASEATDDAIKRATSRLNRWIAAGPYDDGNADLQPMGML